MNSSLVIIPLITPSYTTISMVIFNIVNRKWIFDIGVSNITRKGELFLMIRGSSKSMGAFQKFSTTSLF
jgi:hypothetical protein